MFSIESTSDDGYKWVDAIVISEQEAIDTLRKLPAFRNVARIVLKLPAHHFPIFIVKNQYGITYLHEYCFEDKPLTRAREITPVSREDIHEKADVLYNIYRVCQPFVATVPGDDEMHTLEKRILTAFEMLPRNIRKSLGM